MRFQGVIFDVDGTLVDSNDAHAHAFVEAFGGSGFEVSFQKVRRLIGKGADKLIPELIGRYDEAVAERKSEIFKRKYLPHLRPIDLGPHVGQCGTGRPDGDSAGDDSGRS